MDYKFPEIEEYFIYNASGKYPTGNINATGASQGMKIQRCNYILHFWFSR